jgi:hypothetical protein
LPLPADDQEADVNSENNEQQNTEEALPETTTGINFHIQLIDQLCH